MSNPFRTLRPLFAVVAMLATLLAAAPSIAAPQQPYSDKAFNAAQARGDTVMVEIHADWCPTCKAQLPILDKLSTEPAFGKVVRLRVDFDDQKATVKRFGARMQSTLIVFRGKKEVARSVGVTEEPAIRDLFVKGTAKA